jgi:hypothetical protein
MQEMKDPGNMTMMKAGNVNDNEEQERADTVPRKGIKKKYKEIALP